MARLGRGVRVKDQPWDAWVLERNVSHDRPGASELTRSGIRYQVRKRAKERGEACPAWAAITDMGEAARRGWQKRERPEPPRVQVPRPAKITIASRAARIASSPSPAASGRSGRLGQAAPRAPAQVPRARVKAERIDSATAQPVELPEPLRAWRAQGWGRVVQISGSRVVLHELGAPPKKFASVEAAVAAVG